MFGKKSHFYYSSCLVALLGCPSAFAQDASPDAQIKALQQQLQQQQQQLKAQADELAQLSARIAASPQVPSQTVRSTAGGPLPAKDIQDVRVGKLNAGAGSVPSNSGQPLKKVDREDMRLGESSDIIHPSWTSADGQNSIALTTIFNFDMGGYHYKAQPGDATQALQDGVNVRRARIGLHGHFMGDWVYDMQYDFGNYDDIISDTNGPKSGVKSGYIEYTGISWIKPEAGYLSVPYTLDQATANVDYMFMEHSIPQALAIAVAGGDSRSALGATSYDDRYWVGAFVTGPKAGTSHTTAEQVGGTARATYQVIQTEDSSLHLGVDVAHLFKPPGTQTLNFTIEPEISIDPTSIAGFTLGSTAHPLRTITVLSGEAAGGWRSIFFQGEYFVYSVKDEGLATENFNGGYLQASWTLTGERREYDPISGAYTRIMPAKPFSLDSGDWGAFEIAARISDTDLNDGFVAGTPNSASAVDGGKDVIATLGLNWYPNDYMMFRVNYLHGVLGDLYSNITSAASKQEPAGAHFDAYGMRMQVTF